MFKLFFVKPVGFLWVWHLFWAVAVYAVFSRIDTYDKDPNMSLAIAFSLSPLTVGILYHLWCVYELRRRQKLSQSF